MAASLKQGDDVKFLIMCNYSPSIFPPYGKANDY